MISTDQEIRKLKQIAGEEAINFAYQTEKEWICVCGAHNLITGNQIQNCSNCHTNRDFALENYSQLKCPACGMVNPRSAQICDCGYNFLPVDKAWVQKKIYERRNTTDDQFKKNRIINSPVSNKIILGVLMAVVMFIVGAGFMVQGNKEQNIANQLRESGIITTGTVIDKKIVRGKRMIHGRPISSPDITYRFGNNIHATQTVSFTIFNRLQLNEQVKIRYLAQNPSISEIDGTEKWHESTIFTMTAGFNMLVFSIVWILVQLPICLKLIEFHLSPKAIIQTTIVEIGEKKYKHNGHTSYTYTIIYSFKNLDQGENDNQLFYFEEKVSKTLYDCLRVGMSLMVEYALSNPRLARRIIDNR